MGPKKDPKKEGPKRDSNSLIDEPLNTDFWKCVVVMAVEKSTYDNFVVKVFAEEFAKGYRQEIGHIDFDTTLVKILTDFAGGNLPAKYASLLTFSSILEEANEYLSKSMEIPVTILVKVVKVILFHMRENSIQRVQKYATGPPDPIAAMAERPANFGAVDAKKKEPTKKGEIASKVRPSSFTKEDTKLLKRGEPVKADQRIDDAPLNGYFQLYVLLTGFYQPDLPLELLKGGVPLHGLLCIDTSLSGVNPELTFTQSKVYKPNSEAKALDIQNFWDVFLKILWDPNVCPHFNDTIFQVYIPRRMRCDKAKLREFIYREISYLLYDMSEFKGQLNNYLQHMKVWDVEEYLCERAPMLSLVPDKIPNECVTVPVVLQCIIDNICGNDSKYRLSLSSDSIDITESEISDTNITLSEKGWFGSYFLHPNWSEILMLRGDFEMLNIYRKAQELDYKYDLDDENMASQSMDKTTASDQGEDGTPCDYSFHPCGANMEEALAADGSLRSYWKRYERHVADPFPIDYCLYPLLMTRIFCPFQSTSLPLPRPSSHSSRKNSNLLIEDVSSQMRKPHFTVTESSRNILKALPYNMKDASKDFFSPSQFKIVSPEKLKASSAPQFRVGPHLKINNSFTSQIMSGEAARNLFENLKDFLGDGFFSSANNFHFLEVLSKPQFLEKQKLDWDRYNCVDHTYSIINDCLFIVLHNRMDGQNVHHETFNEALNTTVGLRDFYDYILEDKSEWFASQDSSRLLTKSNTSSESEQPLIEFTDSDFVLENSIKYEHGIKIENPNTKRISNESEKSKPGNPEKQEGSANMEDPISFDFEGYNVSDTAVQFSGLKTVYYSTDSNVTVELIERLYGTQDLGIHITAGGHTLHLYSYVCPEPHILEPFTFHVSYKNGIVVAFGRRFVETFEEIEEIIESKTMIKGKRNSSELSTRVVRRLIPKLVRDEEFIYDMSASFPNGLTIKTVRKAVHPCYIKQQYIGTEEIARTEKCRLFLPNGNIIKMLCDETVQILKPDTSVVTAALSDLTTEIDTGEIQFETFNYVSSEGFISTYRDGEPGPQNRYQILQNTDIDSNQMYFRRRDGTNYMLQDDGSLCVEFKDGTKISSTPNVRENELEVGDVESEEMLGENFGEDDPDDDFVFVYMKLVMEHPAYATVIYDSLNRTYNLLLPEDSTITINPSGEYTIDIDNNTELKAGEWAVQMNKYSKGRQMECTATADLGVFESSEGGVYCHMEDINGKIFIVEVNSNCYILDEERKSEDSQVESLEDSESQQSGVSEFVASADLQSSLSVHTERCCKLSRSNKYFAVRRDMTGFELLHTEDVSEILSGKKAGSFVYTETIPGTDKRVFVLITPEEVKTIGKWQVRTILPNPTYVPNASKRETSSTYCVPPSWMHPFPKRKFKFKIPDVLSCRVFIEARKTDLEPTAGELDCSFCELDGSFGEVQAISAEEMEDHLTKLANNNQDILKEMYATVADSLINEKKKLKPDNSEKLERYLNLSRYYVEQQEYHKRCIRYNTVPDYFHHPAGMSWLILNEIVEKMTTVGSETDVQGSSPDVSAADKSSARSKSMSEFSNEEIEYNLSHSDVNYSELSYRSGLSASTAPAILRTGGICRCKVSPMKDVVSSPVVKCYWQEESSTTDIEIEPRVCDFDQDEIEMMKQRERERPPMTLDDLMCLGLI